MIDWNRLEEREREVKNFSDRERIDWNRLGERERGEELQRSKQNRYKKKSFFKNLAKSSDRVCVRTN